LKATAEYFDEPNEITEKNMIESFNLANKK